MIGGSVRTDVSGDWASALG